jgi:hypothetical protein
MIAFLFRHRIIAASAPWMTAANPFDTEPAAIEKAVYFQCFDHIMRARRIKTAGRRCQRRNHNLVNPHQHYKGKYGDFFKVHNISLASESKSGAFFSVF